MKPTDPAPPPPVDANDLLPDVDTLSSAAFTELRAHLLMLMTAVEGDDKTLWARLVRELADAYPAAFTRAVHPTHKTLHVDALAMDLFYLLPKAEREYIFGMILVRVHQHYVGTARPLLPNPSPDAS